MCRTKGCIRPDFPITTELLEWSNVAGLQGRHWDVIVGVDCLFFKDYHDSLIAMLRCIMYPESVALFFQPKRGDTMQLFIDKASEFFNIAVTADYSPEVRIYSYLWC
jgi:predicted nicotinamide N-methyase